MLPGNGQHVNDSGAYILIPIVVGHGRAFSEEQGDGHAALFRRQRLDQCPLAPGPDDHEPAHERARPATRQPGDAVGGFSHDDLCLDALILEESGIIRLAGIGRPLRCDQAADNFDLIAHV